MTYSLIIPPFTGAVTDRPMFLAIDGLELKKGKRYTVLLDYLLTGIGGMMGVSVADKDGRNEVGRAYATSEGRTGAYKQLRLSFTAKVDGTAATVLRVLMPNGRTDGAVGLLRVRKYLVTEGDYTGQHFSGIGRGFGTATQYQEYGWQGAENRSRSVQNGVRMSASVQTLRENWRRLRLLLWNPRKQVKLTKRWKDEEGVLRTASAMAQFRDGLEPKMTGRGDRAEFQVDMRLAHPFFYPDTGDLYTLQPGSNQISVKGDYPSRRLKILLSGGAWDQVGITTAQGVTVVVQNGGATLAQAIEVDVERFKATLFGAAGGPKSHTKYVTHSGAAEFLVLEPGPQQVSVNWVGTPGTCTISYFPAYL